MISAIVVDDDIDMVDVFSDFLSLKQVKVLGKGYNGKDAYELYKKMKPDIVFVDLVMDNYDGLYALEKIREFDPNSVVVIITGNSSYGQETLKKLKPSGVFYKPFDIRKITDMLKLLESTIT